MTMLPDKGLVSLFQTTVRQNNDTVFLIKRCFPSFTESKSCASRNQLVKGPWVAFVTQRVMVIGNLFGWRRIAPREDSTPKYRKRISGVDRLALTVLQQNMNVGS